MTGPGNNTYLLIGGKGSASLIDAGVGESAHLEELASALDARRARLEMVLVTHGHRDHAGGAPAIAAAYPEAVFTKYPWPEEDAQHRVAWRSAGDGDVIVAAEEPLTALHTPGHSPDHMAFWHQPSATIFTGDLVAQGGSVMIHWSRGGDHMAFWHQSSATIFTGDLVAQGGSVMIHWSRGGDLAQYLASLERLIALAPRRLLPAHGPAVDDPRTVLVGYLEHRRRRERQVLDALRAGHGSVQAIAESIYDGLAPALMQAAQENVRAHLEKLRTDGLAANEDGRWTP